MKRLVLGVLVVATACSAGSSKPAAQPCTGLPSADPAAVLPTGLPPMPGAVLNSPETQGKTHIVHGLVKGTDFVKVRDAYVVSLRTAGWTIDGTDQESVEAEAQFSKNPPLRAGTLKVTPFVTCKGQYLDVRFKLNE